MLSTIYHLSLQFASYLREENDRIVSANCLDAEEKHCNLNYFSGLLSIKASLPTQRDRSISIKTVINSVDILSWNQSDPSRV